MRLPPEDTELERLRQRLAEAEEALRAIGTGEIDAIVVQGAAGPVVYTLKSADTPYRLFVERMAEGALTVSEDGVILYANAAFAGMVGLPLERLRGTDLMQFIASERPPARFFVARGGRDVRLRTTRGEIRETYISSAPLTVDDKDVHCLIVTDLTSQQLRKELEAVLDTVPAAVWFTSDPDAHNARGNRLAAILTRASKDANGSISFPRRPGFRVFRGGVEADPRTLPLQRAARGEQAPDDELEIRFDGGGDPVVILARAASLRDPFGNVVGAVCAALDITERKRSQDRQHALVAELDHRVKNVLATVSAVVSHTQQASRSVASFASALEGRIRSMATTHELLSSDRWRGISLTKLVRCELAAYATGNNTEINGPEVILRPEAGQPMAIVLHELATNAAKHGALSSKNGRVSIRWDQRSNGHARAALVLEWHEFGGPPVAAPSKPSYGTSTIRDLIPYEFGGTVDLVLAPDGVRCRLELPAYWLCSAEDR
jgi:PAS domain S-box-containing protein